MDISVQKPTANFSQQPANIKVDPKIVGAAKEFEAVFISEMMSHMFEGIQTDKMFGGGHGEDMFRSMMINEYGKKIASGNGIGISTEIQKMMVQMQQHNNGG